MFPVKLTEPLTAILYITLDKQHIEELQHAIHVKEVVEGIVGYRFHEFIIFIRIKFNLNVCLLILICIQLQHMNIM